ncbi:MAG: hypothetical protein WCC10_14320 [Tumebacillaceae bacterium]
MGLYERKQAVLLTNMQKSASNALECEEDAAQEFARGMFTTRTSLESFKTFLAHDGISKLLVTNIIFYWDAHRLGTFVGSLLKLGMTPEDIRQWLMNRSFSIACETVLENGYSAADFSSLCFNLHKAGLTLAQIETLLKINRLPQEIQYLAVNGYTYIEVASFLSVNPTLLGGFLVTAGAANVCVQLKANHWASANEIARMVTYVLQHTGGPTCSELVQLLGIACVYPQVNASNIRFSMRGEVGGPTIWRDVLQHLPNFLNHHTGVSASPAGMHGRTLASQSLTSNGRCGNLPISLKVTDQRVYHAKNGHSYEEFDFSYRNCRRSPYSSFYPPGTDLRTKMIALPSDTHVQSLAQYVAWRTFTKRRIGSDKVGVDSYFQSVRQCGQNFYSQTGVTQIYPIRATMIGTRELVAIGRLLGLLR